MCGMKLPRPLLIDPPLGWKQPALGPLPAGEAQRDFPFEMWGGKAVHPPSTAPGFRAAWRLGMLPAPPASSAPPLLPGVSANQWLWSSLAAVAGLFVVLIKLPDDAPALVPFSVGVVGVAAAIWCTVLCTRREVVESDAGYTTRVVFTGLWRLGRQGRVLREPDRSVPPPGWYPSPYYPGLLQRWDGPGWKPLGKRWYRSPGRFFKWPDRPYLEGSDKRGSVASDE